MSPPKHRPPKNPEDDPNRWKPRRRGDIYCSPGCGADCKYADYLAAERAGTALAKELGKGWKPRIHENMAWFYEAVSPGGYISVVPPRHGGRIYSVFVRDHPATVAGGRWVAHGGTARRALRRGLEDIRDATLCMVAAFQAVADDIATIRKRCRIPTDFLTFTDKEIDAKIRELAKRYK